MNTIKIKDIDDTEIFIRKWECENPKAVIQIAHGMTEESSRYEYVAKRLNEEGFIVYANDHRGHGLTAKDKSELGFIAEFDGFHWMVNNMKQINDLIKEENPGAKVILLGHSMGSFLSQRYAELYGDSIDYLILSGTNGKPDKITKLGAKIAKRDIKKHGRRYVGQLINKLSFESFNNGFKPARTPYDWLCSVEGEVDKYIASEYCGFQCTSSFYYDLINGLWTIHESENLNKIPKTLPIYIFAGDKDPVGACGKGIVRLYNTYEKLGIKDLSYKLYKDGRHEMFNEHNKDEVIDDVLSWINKKI